MYARKEAWDDNEWKLNDLSPAAKEAIHRLQPYRSGGTRWNLLWVLNELWNVDKHRHLNVLGFAAVESSLSFPGMPTPYETNHGPVSDGDELAWRTGVDPADRENFGATFRFAVAFGELGSFESISVQEVLAVILEDLRGTVFPRFERFF